MKTSELDILIYKKIVNPFRFIVTPDCVLKFFFYNKTDC